jgi:HK97 gp10 family phage protein
MRKIMAKKTISVKIEGLKELQDGLKELPKATAKNTIRRALTAAAQPIIDTAQNLIRVKRVRPAIVVSKIKFASGSAGKRAFAEALSRGASREEAAEAAHEANKSGDNDPTITSGVASVGPTKRAFYGFEFGTIHQAPQPFMRPAWDQHKQEALDIVREELQNQIEKARARIAAKAQKALLSGK